MSYTPILNIPQVAPGQSDKETTINTGLAILEAAANDSLAHNASAGDVSLNQDQFTKYVFHRIQGHTVARNLWIPDTKRFFVVSNEGTENVVVRPNGSASGSVTVPAAKIMLIQTDGETIRAISSGASLLTDLSDVDVVGSASPTIGDVLSWDGSFWVPGQFSSSTFLGLSDTPSSYTSQALKLTRVNAGATAIEFVTPTTELLEDFPEYSIADATKILGVSVAGELTLFTTGEAGVVTLASLPDTDIPSSIVDGYVLGWDEDGQVWTPISPPAGSFLSLSDTPGSYSGAANYIVKVNPDANGMTFTPMPFIPYALGQLSDVEETTGVADGDILRRRDGVWQPEPLNIGRQPGDFGFYKPGVMANNEVLAVIPFTRARYLGDNFNSSVATIGTSATAQTVLTVRKNGVSIGTLTIETDDSYVFATTGSGEETFSAGDYMEVLAPATADSTLADVAVTFAAMRD